MVYVGLYINSGALRGTETLMKYTCIFAHAIVRRFNVAKMMGSFAAHMYRELVVQCEFMCFLARGREQNKHAPRKTVGSWLSWIKGKGSKERVYLSSHWA